MIKTHIITAALLSITFLAPSTVSAQYQYTSGHGDFRVLYDEVNQEFAPHIHLDSGATYQEDEILIRTDVQRTTLASNPASVARFAGMLGIAAGEKIWVLGGSGVGPYLGFSGEGLNNADWIHSFPDPNFGIFTGSVIHIELTGWSMPAGAQFGLYQTGGLPSTWGNRASGDVIFSTYNPNFTYNHNQLGIEVGSHSHYAFGFTKPGNYDLELTFSSVYQGTQQVSTPATFSFLVGVPEPSAAALLMSGLATLLIGRRRGHRQ